MRRSDDSRRQLHPTKQEAADEDDEREERKELVGELRRGRRRADGARAYRWAAQRLRPAAVQLRPEEAKHRRVRTREGPELNVAVAGSLGVADGEEVADRRSNDVRAPPHEEAEHPRHVRWRARGIEPKTYGCRYDHDHSTVTLKDLSTSGVRDRILLLNISQWVRDQMAGPDVLLAGHAAEKWSIMIEMCSTCECASKGRKSYPYPATRYWPQTD
jgi:hypothetical protein